MASNRYEQLYKTDRVRYAAGQPIALEAGAVLRDTVSDSILVQLKFRNIADKSIKAIKIKVQPLDVAGNMLGEAIEKDYLDFTAASNETFGNRSAIVMANKSTRNFEVALKKVVFSDNEKKDYGISFMLPVQEQIELSKELGPELAEQYCKETSLKANYIPVEMEDGSWLCTCGSLNGSGNKACYHCNCDREIQFSTLNKKQLEEHLQDYKKEQEYLDALADLKTNDLEKIKRAGNTFRALVDYKDAESLQRQCSLKIKEIRNKQKNRKR